MKRVEAIIRPERLGEVAAAARGGGSRTGFTISDVRGHGRAPEKTGEYRGHSYEMLVTPQAARSRCSSRTTRSTRPLGAIASGAATGQVGDGLVAVSEVDSMYRISATSNGAPA